MPRLTTMTAILRSILVPHRHGSSLHRRGGLSLPGPPHHLRPTPPLSTPAQIESKLHHVRLRHIGCRLITGASVRLWRRVQ